MIRPARRRRRASRTRRACADLDGLRIGLLSNGKVNADRLLRMTAEHFVANHGCEIVCDTAKRNASRIVDPQVLRDLSHDVDFLITAVGD